MAASSLVYFQVLSQGLFTPIYNYYIETKKWYKSLRGKT